MTREYPQTERREPRNWRQRSIFWKMYHTLWILWAFIPFFGFIAFAIIGYNSKSRDWYFFSGLYFFFGCFLPIFRPTNTLLLSLTAVFWLVAIGHAFIVRNEYLERLAYIEDTGFSLYDPHPQLRGEFDSRAQHIFSDNYIPDGYENSNPPFSAAPRFPTTYNRERFSTFPVSDDYHNPPPTVFRSGTFGNNKATTRVEIPQNRSVAGSVPPSERRQKIDINTCSENELKALPGISVAKAKKIMDLRAKKNGFRSFDEFATSLALNSHFQSQLESMIYFSKHENENNAAPHKKRRRIVDI